MKSVVSALLFLGMSWSLTTTARAAPPVSPDAKAQATYDAARDAYDSGHFAEALSLFERSLALSGQMDIEFDIARAAEADGDESKALQAYERYLAASPNATNRAFVQARIRRLRGAKPAAARRAGDLRVAPSAGSSDEPTPVVAAPGAGLGPTLPVPAYDYYQPARRIFQVYGGFTLGVAATMEGYEESYDLGASFGLQAGLGWVWRVFGLGMEVRTTWYGELDSISDTAVRAQEFLLKPRLGYKFEQLPLELYATLPHGISRFVIDVFYEDNEAALHVGLAVGATYFVSEHLGINAELGYAFRTALGSSDFMDTLNDVSLLRVNALFGK